jgi:hypothetical protein
MALEFGEEEHVLGWADSLHFFDHYESIPLREFWVYDD